MKQIKISPNKKEKIIVKILIIAILKSFYLLFIFIVMRTFTYFSALSKNFQFICTKPTLYTTCLIASQIKVYIQVEFT